MRMALARDIIRAGGDARGGVGDGDGGGSEHPIDAFRHGVCTEERARERVLDGVGEVARGVVRDVAPLALRVVRRVTAR